VERLFDTFLRHRVHGARELKTRAHIARSEVEALKQEPVDDFVAS